jgi:hypothetical protein
MFIISKINHLLIKLCLFIPLNIILLLSKSLYYYILLKFWNYLFILFDKMHNIFICLDLSLIIFKY